MSDSNSPYQTPRSSSDEVIMRMLAFEFELNGAQMIITGSWITGTELIYCNRKLISKIRSFRKKSHHLIEVNGQRYRVEIEISKIKHVHLICSIYQLHHLIGRYQIVTANPAPKSVRRILNCTYLLIFIAYAVFANIYNLPEAYWVLPCIIIAGIIKWKSARYETETLFEAPRNAELELTQLSPAS